MGTSLDGLMGCFLADATKPGVLHPLLSSAYVSVSDQSDNVRCCLRVRQRFEEHRRSQHLVIAEAFRDGGVAAQRSQRICQVG